MRIGLVSDTHVHDDLAGMPPEIAAAFTAHAVDLILHLGDISSPRVLDVLEAVAPVVAVRDHTERRTPDPRLTETRRVLTVAGKRIGMVHDIGWPSPRIVADKALEFPTQPLEEVLVRKFGETVDVVAFGHTHQELTAQHEGVWFINPGSPTYPNSYPTGELGTVGILDIDDAGRVTPRILRLRSGAWTGYDERPC